MSAFYPTVHEPPYAMKKFTPWPPAAQIEQLRLQLTLLHAWAVDSVDRPPARAAAGS